MRTITDLSLTQKPIYKNAPSPYFQAQFADLLDSQVNDAELSEKEIQDLKSRYNPSNMSDHDNVNLLVELVKKGVFTKQEASHLYMLTPISKDMPEGGSLKAYNPSDNRIPSSRLERTDWLTYYLDIVNITSGESDSEVQSNTIKNFQEYADLLARLSLGGDSALKSSYPPSKLVY